MNKPILAVLIVVLLAGGALFAQRYLSSPSAINISKEDMEAFLQKLPPEQLNQFGAGPEGKEKLRKALAGYLGIWSEAERRGLLQSPEVRSQLEVGRKTLLVNFWRSQNPGADVSVSKEEIDAFYKQNPNAYEEFLKANPTLKGKDAENFKGQYAELCIQSKRAEQAKVGEQPGFKMFAMMDRSQLAAEKLIPELEKQVAVSQPDVQGYYNDHKADFEEVQASHILLSTRPQAVPPTPPGTPGKQPEPPKPPDKQAVKAKAEEILAKVKAGEDFAKLASEFSDDPGSKIKGGDLGFFRKGMMVKPFEETAFKLQKDQINPELVETQFGYHIIKVTDRRAAPLDKTIEDEIKGKLKQEKLEVLLYDLAVKNRVQIADFQFPVKSAAPPPPPAGDPHGHP